MSSDPKAQERAADYYVADLAPSDSGQARLLRSTYLAGWDSCAQHMRDNLRQDIVTEMSEKLESGEIQRLTDKLVEARIRIDKLERVVNSARYFTSTAQTAGEKELGRFAMIQALTALGDDHG